MGVSIEKCARQPRFSIGKCGRQPRFSIGKCGNTNLSCGGIVPKWAGKLPKQELFHRNLEPHRRVKETSPHPWGTRARKQYMVGAVGLEPTILAARDFKSLYRSCSCLLPFANIHLKQQVHRLSLYHLMAIIVMVCHCFNEVRYRVRYQWYRGGGFS